MLNVVTQENVRYKSRVIEAVTSEYHRYASCSLAFLFFRFLFITYCAAFFNRYLVFFHCEALNVVIKGFVDFGIRALTCCSVTSPMKSIIIVVFLLLFNSRQSFAVLTHSSSGKFFFSINVLILLFLFVNLTISNPLKPYSSFLLCILVLQHLFT